MSYIFKCPNTPPLTYPPLVTVPIFAGDDFPRVSAGVLARPGAQDASVHLHPGGPNLPSGGGRQGNVYCC